MTRYVIDSFAWIEYLKGSNRGMAVRKILEDAKNENSTPMIVLSEVVSSIKRQNMNVETALNFIFSLSNIEEVKKDDSIEAGLFHAEMRKKIRDFGLGNAFVVVTARHLGAKILTGDPHFKNMKEAVLI